MDRHNADDSDSEYNDPVAVDDDDDVYSQDAPEDEDESFGPMRRPRATSLPSKLLPIIPEIVVNSSDDTHRLHQQRLLSTHFAAGTKLLSSIDESAGINKSVPVDDHDYSPQFDLSNSYDDNDHHPQSQRMLRRERKHKTVVYRGRGSLQPPLVLTAVGFKG